MINYEKRRWSKTYYCAIVCNNYDIIIVTVMPSCVVIKCDYNYNYILFKKLSFGYEISLTSDS
jgi:hypothetical protein